MTLISRRELLKRVGSAGAAAGLSAAGLNAYDSPDPALIRIAGTQTVRETSFSGARVEVRL
jgi:hypothetical protein